jgi:hypothetical protein
MGERLEKLRLEGLELPEVRHAGDYIYEYIDIQSDTISAIPPN